MKYSLDTHLEQYRSLLEDVMELPEDALLNEEILLEQMTNASKIGLSVADLGKKFPELWQHFQFDHEAEETYRLLLTVQETSLDETLPLAEVSNPQPESALSNLWVRVTDAINEVLFPGFDLVTLGSFQGSGFQVSGEEFRIEPTQIGSSDPPFTVSIDLAKSEEGEGFYSLYCEIEIEDPNLGSQIDGTSVQLFTQETNTLKDEQMWDEHEVKFDAILKAKYMLQFKLGDQTYKVKNINLLNL